MSESSGALARAMVAVDGWTRDYENPVAESDWVVEFEWHRDESNIDKALAAAQVFERRLRVLGWVISREDEKNPDRWASDGS